MSAAVQIDDYLASLKQAAAGVSPAAERKKFLARELQTWAALEDGLLRWCSLPDDDETPRPTDYNAFQIARAINGVSALIAALDAYPRVALAAAMG